MANYPHFVDKGEGPRMWIGDGWGGGGGGVGGAGERGKKKEQAGEG